MHTSLCLLSFFHWVFNPDFFIEYLQSLGSGAFCGFILIYIFLTMLGIPGTVMTIAAGTVFGLIWGTILSVIGATLGAVAAFWMARYGLRNWIKRRFSQHKTLKTFNRAIRKRPWQFVLAVRFAPISPFNIVNFLFGLTPIHWVPYSVGTFFGIVPGTLAYTWLGVTGGQALTDGDRLPFIFALGLLSLLSLLPIVFREQRRNQLK
jgi:uncharacterized membrane protein YdjX (TVP38/TMEM64 family)